MTSAPDYYEILQVSPKADEEIIQAAYRRLAQKWHPDKNPGDPFAYERMKLLNEAYETLSDARRRREYDQRRMPSTGAKGAQQEPEQPETVEAGPSCSESEVVRWSYEKVSSVAKIIFFIGVFVFVLAHATDSLLVLIMIISGRILFFGIPAYFCSYYRMRIGLIVFASLFLIEAAVSVYVRYVEKPRLEKQLSEMAEAKVSSPASVTESSLPAKLSPATRRSAKQHIDSGVAWIEEKDYDLAIDEFDEAIRLNPTSAFAFHKRGWCWIMKNNRDKALADFSEAIRLDPTDAQAWSMRGNIWLQKQEYDKAMVDYDEAIRRDPKNMVAFGQRAWLWTLKGNYDAVIRDYDEVIKLDPKCGGAYGRRGQGWVEKKQYEQAIKDFERAVRFAPDDDDNYRLFAQLLASCPNGIYRDGERAVLLATKGCELSSWKSAPYLDVLAMAYAEAGDFDQAVRYQKKALEDKNWATEVRVVARFRERLELYKQKKPFRQTH